MPDQDHSDLALLSAYRGGRTEAFDALHARYRDVLYLHARALCGDAAAEDLVNEAFLRLARAGNASLPTSGSLAPFLHTVLRRLAIDRTRAEKASRQRERDAGLQWMRTTREEADPLQMEELNRALQQLPLDQLELVILHVYAEMTFQQAADTVGVPLKTAISRYRFALGKLSKMLGGPR